MSPPRTAEPTNLEIESHIVYKADDNYVFKRGHYSTEPYEEASFLTELAVQFQFYVLVLFAIISAVLRNLGILKTFYPLERPEQSVSFYFSCTNRNSYKFRTLRNLKIEWNLFTLIRFIG